MKRSIYAVWLKAAKAAAGACVAIALAMAMGLSYATAAGVITLLSLQETKKETLRTAFQRLLAFLAAVLIAYASFALLGYTLLALGVYLLLFVALCHQFSMTGAIAMCSVLITHFWAEGSMSPAFVGNELMLLFIGAGVGILLNLFLPVQVQLIQQAQRDVEEINRCILTALADGVEGKGPKELAGLPCLERRLAQARAQAQQAEGNALTLDLSYYREYIDMRGNQLLVLQRVQTALLRLQCVPPQAELLATFFRSIAASFGESNNAVRLLGFATELRNLFRDSPLPQSREEFEARATLLHIFNEMEHFVLLKYTFAQSLTREQRKQYWKEQEAPV